MSAECSGVLLWGFDGRDTWGSVQRRPLQTLHLIHFGAPVLADEEAVNSTDVGWSFPHSIIVRPDPADFAYDAAYMVLYRAHTLEPDAFVWPDALADWHNDPRNDEKSDRRSRGHGIIHEVARQAPRVRLQVVQFDLDAMLGPGSVKVWADLGFAVEQYQPEENLKQAPL